eukprot:1141405-Pelagomonas_calceolata.AAC.2
MERVRLLGGPSSEFSLCILGGLALIIMVEPSPGGVLRASLSSGLMLWVEGRTMVCVGVWIECIGEAVLALCLERVCLLGGSLCGHIRRVVLVLGRLAVGAGPGLTLCVRRRRRPVTSCLKRVLEGGCGAGTSCVGCLLLGRGFASLILEGLSA